MQPNQTLSMTNECIKGTYQWGSAIYHNICEGYVYIVPTGMMDKALYLMLLLVIVLVVASVAAFVIFLVRS